MIEKASRGVRAGVIVAASVAAILWSAGAAFSGAPSSGAAESPAAEKPAAQPAPKYGRGAQVEKDWPCEQRYVDTLSWGTMWAGPPLDDALKSWHNNNALPEIITYLTDDTTSDADGVKRIEAFAKSLEGDKKKQLTELFAGLFETMNDRRTSFQESIKRYFRRQEAQAKTINEIQADLRELEKKKVPENDPRMLEQQKLAAWNNRVYDDRQKLIPYVCQIPILVEQKLGAYARAIQAQMPQ